VLLSEAMEVTYVKRPFTPEQEEEKEEKRESIEGYRRMDPELERIRRRILQLAKVVSSTCALFQISANSQ
jgi:hypothetical protein